MIHKTEDVKNYGSANGVGLEGLVFQMIQSINQSSHQQLESLLTDFLKLTGQYFNSERCYVFFYSGDKKYTSIRAQWTKEGIIPFSEWKDIPLVHFQYVAGRLLKGEIFKVNKITDIPEEAVTERNGMIAEGVKSVLLVPFKSEKQTLGFIGIDMVSSERKWEDNEVDSLKLFGSVIGNLEIKKQARNTKNFQEAIADMFYEESLLAIGIFVDNVMVDCNAQTLELLECTKHELIGKSFYDLTYWEDVTRKEQEIDILEIAEQSVKGEKFIRDWKVRRPNGTMIHAQLAFQGFHFQNKIYVVITAIDISNRVEKEEQLLLRHEQLQKRLDKILSPSAKISKLRLLDILDREQLVVLQEAFSLATGIPSVITDVEGNIISSKNIEKSVCELIQQSQKGQEICRMSNEILKTKILESHSTEWHKCIGCGFLDAAAPIVVEGAHLGTWWIGKVKPVDANKKRLLSFSKGIGIDVEQVSKTFEEMNGIDYDVFENALHLLKVLTVKLSTLAYNNIKLGKALQTQKRMERKLEKAKQKAEESDRLKSAFLANMSHEIRTPMNGIVGFTELIQNPEIEPDERINYISIIQESSNQLLNIINDIIDISKIEAGQIDINNQEFILNDLFKELELFYGALSDEKGIELLVEFSREELAVRMDRVKLKQVFSNLIGNAIKFTNAGFVKFGVKTDGEALNFYVEDTGIGIGIKDQKQIFNRFWQVGKYSSNKGGTGLGLTITKAYVELMGGTIELKSKIDVGSRFDFTIPFFRE
ncbi:PAS domain S-box protein [Labilibacter sediminis]|nr:PAS domain S-box protein [Labilibacter sediminis]